MRAPRVRTIPKPTCVICKRNICVDNKIQNCLNLKSMRITRQLKKLLDYINDFIILENYRCMPLLGGEENVPNWDVHIVRYSIVYAKEYIK